MPYKDKKKQKKYQHQWYVKNRKKIFRKYKKENYKKLRRLYREKWRANNKEKIKLYRKIWTTANVDRLRILRKKLRKKYVLKPEFRIKHNLRNRIRKVLKGKSKSKSTMDLLGVPNISFFKKYLERKFKQGMSWNNYGKDWHIDHIIPCAFFDLTKAKEQTKCFNYTNHQPLWASENLAKGAKIN